ncbi:MULTISPECIES: hypothetical protein [unclassified Bradyrhizobium]|uniref:hypothetical protein n=1 Tax=unclassified Bradyrhizobium TaxID=2631580 RepID=UPI0028E219E0|nr:MULTISPECIES: hypothetical protein [unclassified Bradyrhizobium]
MAVRPWRAVALVLKCAAEERASWRKFMTTINDLLDSEGMKFLNRMHERSFSINIFRLNAHELISALTSGEDVGLAIANMNTPLSQIEMAQCARSLHNFLVGAMTLVDHTRVFFKKYYDGTEMRRIYAELVKNTFSGNQETRFVQDLRNFMTHRALLPIERHITITRDPESGEQSARAGFQLVVAELQNYDWNSDAKKFLARQSDKIELLPLVNNYTSLIETFHEDINKRLEALHSEDLVLMTALREQMDREQVKRTS